MPDTKSHIAFETSLVNLDTSPLRVSVSPNKGRCFVAARDIAPGELLLDCTAYGGAVIVDSGARRFLCANPVCGSYLLDGIAGLPRERDGEGNVQGSTDTVINEDLNNNLEKKAAKHSTNGDETVLHRNGVGFKPVPQPLPFGCPHNCGFVAYCSQRCSHQDWASFHSYECEFLLQRVLPGCGDDINLVQAVPATFLPNEGEQGCSNGNTLPKRVGPLPDGTLDVPAMDPYVLDYLRLLLRVLIARYKEVRNISTPKWVNDASGDHTALPISVPQWSDMITMTANLDNFPKERVEKEFRTVASKMREFAESLGLDQRDVFGDQQEWDQVRITANDNGLKGMLRHGGQNGNFTEVSLLNWQL
ncbi:hypothetical protein HDU93_009489 [Gonapodya sp. JEL0774]|nr:hypothetical protein HDU93_009489 [Gonapodya sp. JEL0774]